VAATSICDERTRGRRPDRQPDLEQFRRLPEHSDDNSGRSARRRYRKWIEASVVAAPLPAVLPVSASPFHFDQDIVVQAQEDGQSIAVEVECRTCVRN
jgi:hypothetical protein